MKYEEYKVKWMAEHDYTLNEYMDRLMEICEEQSEKDPDWNYLSLKEQMDTAMNIFDDEGFAHGDCWVCEAEFELRQQQKKERNAR